MASGLARAAREGRRGGNPGVVARDPDALRRLQHARADAYLARVTARTSEWLPLVIRLPGMSQVARGLQVKLDLVRWDEVDLTVEARLLEIVFGFIQPRASRRASRRLARPERLSGRGAQGGPCGAAHRL